MVNRVSGDQDHDGCRISGRYLGAILLGLAGVAAVPGLVAVACGDANLAVAFLTTAALYGGVGWPLRRMSRPPDRRVGSLLATMALAWLVAPCIGAVPFAAHFLELGRPAVVIDSAFEAMSGFTSCGLTIVAAPAELPACLQLWRSLTQWVGGLGIAALMLTAMRPSEDGRPIVRAEIGRVFAGGARAAARWSWSIYIGLTVLAMVGFLLVGRPWWESLNHALTTVSTGGFSVTNSSVAEVGIGAQVVAATFMFAGALSFQFYHRVLTARALRALWDRRAVALLPLAVMATLLVLALADSESGSRPDAPTAAFECISALATGGFSSTDLRDWSPAMLGVLALLMFVGPMSGSTGGGVKIERVGLVLRAIWWRVSRAFLPDRPRMRVVERERMPEDAARLLAESAATLIAVWFVTILGAAFALTICLGNDATFAQVWFEVVSALSSVGLSAGITTPDAPAAAKLLLLGLMWLGRLELFAGLFLLTTVLRAIPKRTR